EGQNVGVCHACVERFEYAQLIVWLDHCSLLKSRVARELRHVFGTFRVTAVLRRDRHLSDPILQPFHRFIMSPSNFRFDVAMIAGCCEAMMRCKRECGKGDEELCVNNLQCEVFLFWC